MSCRADCLDPGGPEHVAQRDEPNPQVDAICRDVGHHRPEANLDTHALQITLRARTERWIECRQQTVASFEQDDARRPCVDVPVVLRNRLSGDLFDRAGEFHAGRTAADDAESESGPARLFAPLVFSGLEGQQDSPPKLDGIVEALQPRREGRPVVVAKVRMRRASAGISSHS